MKKMLVALGLLAAIAVAAWAQASGTNAVERNGYYFNATTGQKTDADGNAYTSEAVKDRDAYLAPVSIYSGQIAAGAADTTDIVDLSTYKNVALLIQVSGTANSSWVRFAVHARYNLAGLSDSLSMFSLPCLGDTASTTGKCQSNGTVPSVAGLASDEFPVTLTLTQGNASASSAMSLPQGKVVWLTQPGGANAWPSRCSFRVRNIGRSTAIGAAGPTVRVWVMGTPL